MALTSIFKFSKPEYQTVRYDLQLNANFDRLEAALLGFPGANPPGSEDNWPDVVPSAGMSWLDTTNNQLCIYYNDTWNVVHSF